MPRPPAKVEVIAKKKEARRDAEPLFFDGVISAADADERSVNGCLHAGLAGGALGVGGADSVLAGGARGFASRALVAHGGLLVGALGLGRGFADAATDGAAGAIGSLGARERANRAGVEVARGSRAAAVLVGAADEVHAARFAGLAVGACIDAAVAAIEAAAVANLDRNPRVAACIGGRWGAGIDRGRRGGIGDGRRACVATEDGARVLRDARVFGRRGESRRSGAVARASTEERCSGEGRNGHEG